MNHLCPKCGFRMVNEELIDWYACENCGHRLSGMAVHTRPAPTLHHGTRCPDCNGEGYIEVEAVQRHPYGDGYAEEVILETKDCETCLGLGCFPDEDSCIVCGEPVKDGVECRGFEVHEGCFEG